MQELNTEKYHFLEKPLSEIKINTLFARSVIEKKIKGKIFVDDVNNPKTFYVVHPYGMSLLFGAFDNPAFNNHFRAYCLNTNNQRNTFEWLQAYPTSWNKILKELLRNKLVEVPQTGETPNNLVEQDIRVNFKFDRDRYLTFKQLHLKDQLEIKRTNKESFLAMKGTVVPAHFWDNAEEFCKNGIGFSLFSYGNLATTAYSAFIFPGKLELGMETVPQFRGKGFAQYACSALIDYCLENNYEPVWACKMSNIPSYKLAQKLGFVPDLNLPYYRLAL